MIRRDILLDGGGPGGGRGVGGSLTMVAWGFLFFLFLLPRGPVWDFELIESLSCAILVEISNNQCSYSSYQACILLWYPESNQVQSNMQKFRIYLTLLKVFPRSSMDANSVRSMPAG